MVLADRHFISEEKILHTKESMRSSSSPASRRPVYGVINLKVVVLPGTLLVQCLRDKHLILLPAKQHISEKEKLLAVCLSQIMSSNAVIYEG